MIDLGALKIGILTDADKANKELNSVGDTATKQESKFSKFGSALKTGATVGAGAVVALGGAMLNMAKKTSEATDEIDKQSLKMGISRKGYQEWDYAMGQSGMSIDTLKVGMKTLVTQMDGANEGSAKSVDAFNKLGIAWDDGTGKLKGQEEMMQEAIFALADMDDKTEQAKLATELFGKAGIEMIPMLAGGSEGIKDLTQKANDLGIILNDETIDAGVLLGDTMDDVKKVFGNLTNELGAIFMPMLQVMLVWVLAHMPEIKATFKVVFDVIKVVIGVAVDIIKVIYDVLKKLYDWVQPYLPAMQRTVETVFEGIGAAVDVVVGIFNGFIKVIKTAWDWLTKWNNTKADSKDTSIGSSARSYVDGRHADGLDYVPFDGYIAELHKGERVLTANENKNGQSMKHSGTITVKGVNNSNELQGVVEVVMDQLRREVRFA